MSLEAATGAINVVVTPQKFDQQALIDIAYHVVVQHVAGGANAGESQGANGSCLRAMVGEDLLSHDFD